MTRQPKHNYVIDPRRRQCHMNASFRKRLQFPEILDAVPHAVRATWSETLLRSDKAYQVLIGQEELVGCSSDYSTRWLAIK
jgi:hypothetical protein